MRRLIIGLLAALLGSGIAVPAALAAAPPTGVAKVVLIVGPAGAATDRYRAQAREAAKLARRYTPDVTEIYSPDATWPAVKQALQGASLVVYMGHGNGWPSRYRDELYPPTQNGFGLNPSAGGGDGTHQYFGEAKIAESIQLARNAVVLLNHLCYASGNTEPGLPEGSLEDARQRVDNFAAGFIAAGAAAVVAEAYGTPNHMVRDGARRSVAHRNGVAQGADRERQQLRLREPPKRRATSPRWTPRTATPASIARSSSSAGWPRPTSCATRAAARAAAPCRASTRPSSSRAWPGPGWRSRRRGSRGTPPAGRCGTASRTRSRTATSCPTTCRPACAGTRSTRIAAPADPEAQPDFGLVMAERVGDVVAPVGLEVSKKYLSIKVTAPAAPGRYRLSVTLHDKDGVAFDDVSQAMVRSLIVRLTGPHDAGVVAPASVDLAPGDTHKLSVWVTNLGRGDWGHAAIPGERTVDNARNPSTIAQATHARIVGTWVPLGGVDDPAQVEAAAAAAVTPTELPAGFAPRDVIRAELVMYAPTTPGDYLLLVDILTPEIGSLAAQGVEPTVVRVHVAEAPAATPAAVRRVERGAVRRRRVRPRRQRPAAPDTGALAVRCATRCPCRTPSEASSRRATGCISRTGSRPARRSGSGSSTHAWSVSVTPTPACAAG